MKILAQRCGAYFRVQRLHSVRDLAHGGPGHVEAAHLRQRPGVRILTRETIPVVVRHVRTNRKGYGVPVGREHHFSSASGTFAVKNIHKEVDTVKTGILDKYSFAVSPIIRPAAVDKAGDGDPAMNGANIHSSTAQHASINASANSYAIDRLQDEYRAMNTIMTGGDTVRKRCKVDDGEGRKNGWMRG